jgi:hypothetical protein
MATVAATAAAFLCEGSSEGERLDTLGGATAEEDGQTGEHIRRCGQPDHRDQSYLAKPLHIDAFYFIMLCRSSPARRSGAVGGENGEKTGVGTIYRSVKLINRSDTVFLSGLLTEGCEVIALLLARKGRVPDPPRICG